MTEKKYYKTINDWCGLYCKEEDFTEAELRYIVNEYRNIVCPAICSYWFGINRKTALGIADNLGYGNWRHLWLTEEEQALSLMPFVFEVSHKSNNPLRPYPFPRYGA